MEGVRVRVEHLVLNTTKPDGSYRLYVPPGTHRIRFEPPGPRYIFPRITEPLAIVSPVTVDRDLGGVEWRGTVRRIGTGEPVPDIGLVVTQVGDLT